MLKGHGMDTYVVLRMERDWRLLRVDGRRGCNPEAQIWEHVVDIELQARERVKEKEVVGYDGRVGELVVEEWRWERVVDIVMQVREQV
jgi:hypothetical protein